MKHLVTLLVLACSTAAFAESVNLGNVRVQGILETKMQDPITGRIEVNSQKMEIGEIQNIINAGELGYLYYSSKLSLDQFYWDYSLTSKTRHYVELPASMMKMDGNGDIYFQAEKKSKFKLPSGTIPYISVNKDLRIRDAFTCEEQIILKEGVQTVKCVQEIKLPLIKKLDYLETHFELKDWNANSYPCEAGADFNMKKVLKTLEVSKARCKVNSKDCVDASKELSRLVKGSQYYLHERKSGNVDTAVIEKVTLTSTPSRASYLYINFLDKNNNVLIKVETQDGYVTQKSAPACGVDYFSM